MRLGDFDALKEEFLTKTHLTLFELLDLIDNAPTVPQVTVFSENADEKAIADMKEELKKVIDDSRPQGESVIRCQDCKHQVKKWREDRRMKEKGYWAYGCKHFGEIMGYWGFGGNDDEFCSDAEQKGGAE